MSTDHDDTGFEPEHASSPTDHVLSELQLYGFRPFQDEPDPRPLPEGNIVAGAIADIFDALIVTLGDTRLEPDLDDLLWRSEEHTSELQSLMRISYAVFCLKKKKKIPSTKNKYNDDKQTYNFNSLLHHQTSQHIQNN